MPEIPSLFNHDIELNSSIYSLESIILSIKILDNAFDFVNMVDMVRWFEKYDPEDVHFNKFMLNILKEFQIVYGQDFKHFNLAAYIEKDRRLLDSLFTEAITNSASDIYSLCNGLSCSLKAKYKYWICANQQILFNNIVYNILEFNQGYQYDIDNTLYNDYELLEYFVYSYEITGKIHFDNQDWNMSFNHDLTLFSQD